MKIRVYSMDLCMCAHVVNHEIVLSIRLHVHAILSMYVCLKYSRPHALCIEYLLRVNTYFDSLYLFLHLCTREL